MKCVVMVIHRGYSGTGMGSKVIERFTFGDKSHNSTVFVFNTGQEIEWESIQGKGVTHHIPRTHKEAVFTEYLVPVTEVQAEQMWQIAISLFGCSYDWRGIYGFLVRRKTQDKSKWFCSEGCSYLYYKVGYPLSRREPYRETPSTTCESLRLIKLDKDRNPVEV